MQGVCGREVLCIYSFASPVRFPANICSQLQQAIHGPQAFRNSSFLKCLLLFQISVTSFVLHAYPVLLLGQLQQVCAWDIPTFSTPAATPPLQHWFAWAVQVKLKASCTLSLKWDAVTTLLNMCIPQSLYLYTKISVLTGFFGSSHLACIRQKKVALCNVAATGLQIPSEAVVLQVMTLQSSLWAWAVPPPQDCP